MSADLIRIARDGKTIGEYTLADLGRAIKAKTVLATDYYWRAGMTGWERVELIAEEAVNPPESAPASRKQKSWAVLVAVSISLIAILFAVSNLIWGGSHNAVSSVSSVAPAKVAAEFFSGKPSTPLRSEFYQDKYGKMYFKVWIEKESDIPYDEFTWKITKVAAPDGKRFSNSYPTSRSLLLKGRFMNSHAWGGVNPYGSDCQSGDRFIIEIPRFAPLSIDVPDTSKGLKVLPYSH